MRAREAGQEIRLWRIRLACLALCGLCLLPFLIPLRTLPISSFYAEWLALALGLAALPGLVGRTELLIPRIAVLPAGLALLLLLQTLWLPPALRSAALPGLLYLLWALLLMLVTAALLRDVSLPRLAGWLALALGLAALINACNVILFQTGVRTGFAWGFLHTARAGNVGQANLLADLLWLGVVSILLRWHGSGGRGWLHALWLLPVLLASALIGARAPMLYALWIALAALLFGDARLRRAACALALFYFVVVLLVHGLAIPITDGTDSLSRMLPAASAAEGAELPNIRLALMGAAAAIFLAHPLQGAGWGSFAWESYSRADDSYGTLAVAEHAHQIFFQLAAELGLIAPLLALLALLAWARPLWQARQSLRGNLPVWWASSAAGVVLLHAQLEYPLWFSHLLGILAILLVCADQRRPFSLNWRCSALGAGALMLTGAYLLAASMHDYRRLEHWLYADMQRGKHAAPDGHYQVLAELSGDSLLQPQAVRALAAVILPTREQLEGKREVCRFALRSEPQVPAVFTCALLDALAGEAAQAEQGMRQALRVFPDELKAYRERMQGALTAAQLAELRPWLEAK
jgi:hypothetical protein